MTTTYNNLLRLAEIGNGEQSGTWGTTTNSNLGTLICDAIAGVESIPLGVSTSYILTSYDGVADQSRNAVLEFTGSPASTVTVTAPNTQKLYVIKNSTSQVIKMVRAGGGSAAVIPPVTTPPASTATITIASPAIITVANTPADGTPVVFTTTGALPTGLTAATTYYVKYVSNTTFNVSATVGGSAIATSGSQSGTHTATFGSISTVMLVYCDGTNMTSGLTELPSFATSGGIPITTTTGTQTLTNKTLTAPKFADGGFIADANGNELIVMDTVASAVNEITVSNAASSSLTATMTIAAPCVVTVSATPANGTPVVFTTTGALPTGLSAGTTYYVKRINATTFNVAATPGGTSITTTGSQSGTHTAAFTGMPTLSTSGDGTNVSLNITPKGAGVVQINGNQIASAASNTFTGNQVIEVTDNTNAALRITQLGTGEALRVEDSANPDSTPFIVSAGGSVGVGVSPVVKLQVYDASSSVLRVEGDSTTLMQMYRYSTDANASSIQLYKGRGTKASPTIISSGDAIGSIFAGGWNGTSDFNTITRIDSYADTVASGSSMSSSIRFSTANAAASSTERFRIGPAGQLGVGGANYGTSGQVLTSGGSSAAPSWASPNTLTYLAFNASVGTGTTYEAKNTVITAPYKKIEIIFNNITQNSGGSRRLQIYISGDNGGSYTAAQNVSADTNTISGVCTIHKADQTSGARLIQSFAGQDTSNSTGTFAATTASVTGDIDAIKLGWDGSGSFSGGTVTIIGYN